MAAGADVFGGVGLEKLWELVEGVDAAELTTSERLLVAGLLSPQDWDNYLYPKNYF